MAVVVGDMDVADTEVVATTVEGVDGIDVSIDVSVDVSVVLGPPAELGPSADDA